MSCKPLPPFSQHAHPNVEPFALFAHRLDDHVHMRMRLVRMQHHRVSMLERKLLAREVPDRAKYLVRRSPRWHGKHQLMNQLLGALS
jgi:hypothetical protein